MERRKVTFKLYPNATQADRLTGWVRLHCELYNAALEERISAYQKHGKSIGYYDQQNVLPEIKAARPEFVELGSHALQQTLRKLDLAFQAFFRRVTAGQTPGFRASRQAGGFQVSAIQIRPAGNWRKTARVAQRFASAAAKTRCRSALGAGIVSAKAPRPTI